MSLDNPFSQSRVPQDSDSNAEEVAEQAYKQKLTELNDSLSEFDSLSARQRSGEELTPEEQIILENPADQIEEFLAQRDNLIKENYRFHDFISAASEDSDIYQHIESHLNGGFGSNFSQSEVFPGGMDVVKFGEDVLDKAYKGSLEGDTVEVNGHTGQMSIVEGGEGGRLVVKIEFDKSIGTNALLNVDSVNNPVDISETSLDEDVKGRYQGTQVAIGSEKEPTNTMFVIGGPYGPTGEFGLYTVYCGEYAPPAPSDRSSEADLEFWQGKVWATEDPAPKEQTEVEESSEEMQDELFRIEDPKEEYDEVWIMFLSEHLDENIDEVRQQLENIRSLIQDHESLNEKLKEDLDYDIYVDEADLKVKTALQNFTINGKVMDIQRLCDNSFPYQDAFNEIVVDVNEYISSQMIGSSEAPIVTY